jgi:hypothetical protein
MQHLPDPILGLNESCSQEAKHQIGRPAVSCLLLRRYRYGWSNGFGGIDQVDARSTQVPEVNGRSARAVVE